MIAEYKCLSCKEFSALVVGDEVDIDDPNTETVLMICHAPEPRPVLRHFMACNYVYRAPADTMTMTQCPRCRVMFVGQTYPKPSAPK